MKINNEDLLQTTGLNFETMEDAIFLFAKSFRMAGMP